MKCKHKNAKYLAACIYKATGPLDRIVDGCRKCRDCHEMLSLGHSDESDEQVAVEIRAAEIATAFATGNAPTLRRSRFKWTPMEVGGWNAHALGEATPTHPAATPGYLARCIHETETA